MHDMVYIASSDNHVYAYAESHLISGFSKPLWSACLGTPVTRSGSNIPPPLGITSTPVLDPASGRVFVCSYQDIGGDRSIYRMYALDVDTGAVIQSAPLNDRGAPGRPTFDPSMADQRGALNLVGGRVYATFAAFLAYDLGTYHGWIVGCNAGDLNDQWYFSTTTNVLAGGVWGPGGAASEHGVLYVATGNSTTADAGYWAALPAGKHPGDIGDYFIAVVKLGVASSGYAAHLDVLDWYQPTNAQSLNDQDLDLGSSSPLLLPVIGGMTMLVVSAKDAIYLLNRNNMGHWGGELQRIALFPNESHSAPAYYLTPGGDHYVYFSGGGSPGLVCYKVSVSGGAASLVQVWKAGGTGVSFATECSSPTVGSVTAPGPYALVWVADAGTLHAYDALTGTEVYTSSATASDNLGPLPHYPPVTCAGKSVYVGTNNGFACYRVVDSIVIGLVMAWKGIEGDDGIYYSSFQGGWAPQQKIAGVGTSHGPSLAVFNEKVYAAWKGIEGDQGLYYSSFDGNSWAPQQNVPGDGTSVGPSLAACNGTLFMAWKGIAGDDGIYYSYLEGASWAPQRNVPGVGTSVGPSLAAFEGRLYMAWKGIEGDDGIYYSVYGQDGWAPQRQVSGTGTSVGPSLAAFNGSLFMAWKGIEGDQGIYYSMFNNGLWAPQQQLGGVGTSVGPSLATYGDHLYMAWKGIEGDDGIYYSSFDGAGWAPQQNVTGVGTSVGPGLAWIGL